MRCGKKIKGRGGYQKRLNVIHPWCHIYIHISLCRIHHPSVPFPYHHPNFVPRRKRKCHENKSSIQLFSINLGHCWERLWKETTINSNSFSFNHHRKLHHSPPSPITTLVILWLIICFKSLRSLGQPASIHPPTWPLKIEQQYPRTV